MENYRKKNQQLCMDGIIMLVRTVGLIGRDTMVTTIPAILPTEAAVQQQAVNRAKSFSGIQHLTAIIPLLTTAVRQDIVHLVMHIRGGMDGMIMATGHALDTVMLQGPKIGRLGVAGPTQQ